METLMKIITEYDIDNISTLDMKSLEEIMEELKNGEEELKLVHDRFNKIKTKFQKEYNNRQK